MVAEDGAGGGGSQKPAQNLDIAQI